MVKASRHRPVGSFLTRSRASARPALEALEVRLAPAVYTVTSTLDDGSAGTLRACIAQANATSGVADTIDFAVTGTIHLSSELQITDALSIVGPGAATPGANITIQRDSGAGSFRLLEIDNVDVSLSDLEFTGGNIAGIGAGILDSGGALTVSNCYIHDNAASGGYGGGGIYATGTLAVTDCNFQSNSAGKGGYGGGIFVEGGKATFTGTTFEGNLADRGGGVYGYGVGPSITLDFSDCTFSANQAVSGDGGAVATFAGSPLVTADFFDCTLADNASTGGTGVGGVYAYTSEAGSNVFGYEGTLFGHNSSASLGGAGLAGVEYSLVSSGHNLSTDGVGMSAGDIITPSPDLGSLGYYGGPTPTIPLMSNSPAIDAGVTIAGIGTDQRGVARPQGSAPDIGAFELRPARLVLDTSDVFANVGVAFSRSGSVTGDGSATVYVDYGDQAPDPPAPDFALSHAYTAEGSYTVTVNLVDNMTYAILDTKQFQVDVFLDGVPTGEVQEQTTSGPGVAIVNATDPGDGSSVTASLLHVANTNASLLVAIVPNSVAAALNGSSQIAGDTITSSYDVRAINVGIGDQITVVFHYFGNTFDQPVLRYYNRNTGQEGVVETDTYIVDPITKTITLVLDADSTPGILDLSGTVFTIAVPLAVGVSPAPTPAPAPDPTTVSALANGGGIGTGFATGSGPASGEGGSGGGASASFQVTGSQTFVVVASFTALTSPFSDDSVGGRSSNPNRANLLADLPIVPDSLITLPGPILTPGSAEMPVPDEPPKANTPAQGVTPPTSRLDDFGGGAHDEAFARFDDGRLALRLHSLPCWTVEGEAGDEPADWRDTSLAIAAFVAARPPGPRRRSSANAPAAR